MEHNVRSTKSGGGVALFVRNGIDYHVRNDLTVMNESLETLFIEIDKDVTNSHNNIIIGVYYRPPGTDISIFSEELNTTVKLKTDASLTINFTVLFNFVLCEGRLML